MKCIECKSENLKRPEQPRSALELLECLDCGHAFYVHCNYPIPDELKGSQKVFIGYCSVTNSRDSVKVFIKLKGLLEGCEWFQLSKLEKQKNEKLQKWELGQFLESEVDRIEAQSKEKGIKIDFVEVPNA